MHSLFTPADTLDASTHLHSVVQSNNAFDPCPLLTEFFRPNTRCVLARPIPQGQHRGAVRLRVDQRLRSADHSLCLRPCYTTHMSRSLYLPAAAFDNPKQCAPDQPMILKVTSQWP